MKIIKSLKEFGLLIKCVSETRKNEAKEQKSGSIGILSGTLGASLGDTLDKGVIRAGKDKIRAGERTIREFNAASSFN